MNTMMAHESSAPAVGVPDSAQYLTFVLGRELFALGILAIKEIIEYGTVRSVPMMPPSVRGVINLRGAVVPVVDLCARFGRPPSAVTKRTCIVIVEVVIGEDRQDVGVVVDAVNAVIEVRAEDIQPAPAFGAGIRADFIEGMGRLDSGFVIILNAASILAAQELEALSGDSTARLRAS